MYEHVSADLETVLTQIGCTIADISHIMGTRSLLVGFDGMMVVFQLEDKPPVIPWEGKVYRIQSTVEAVERVNKVRREMIRCAYSIV